LRVKVKESEVVYLVTGKRQTKE